MRAWALEAGKNPLMRVALCGYAGERKMPGWTMRRWKTQGGYWSQGDGRGLENATREANRFGPACLGAR